MKCPSKWDSYCNKIGLRKNNPELNKLNTGSLPWRVDSLLSVGQTKLLTGKLT